jgi:hypothetical protein
MTSSSKKWFYMNRKDIATALIATSFLTGSLTAEATSSSINCGRGLIKKGDSLSIAREKCSNRIESERSWTEANTRRTTVGFQTVDVHITVLSIRTSRSSVREVVFINDTMDHAKD